MNPKLKYPYGVYMKPNGKLILLSEPESDQKWAVYQLNEGKKRQHPLFRITLEMCSHFSEGYAEDVVGKCEYLGEL